MQLKGLTSESGILKLNWTLDVSDQLFACQYAMIRGYIFEMAGYDLGKITGMV
jgi:hypothetical protein